MKLRNKTILYGHHHSEINWDELRNNKLNAPYWIPDKKDEYIFQRTLSKKERNYINFLKKYIELHNIKRIFSLGSGRANFEFFLKKEIELPVTISDFSSSILKIKEFELFDEVIQIDFKTDFKINDLKNTLIILPRIDTELTDQELESLIRRLKIMGTEHIFFITAQLLTVKALLVQLKIYLKKIFFNLKLVDAGTSRSKSEFIFLFSKYYKISMVDNFKSFMLTN